MWEEAGPLSQQRVGGQVCVGDEGGHKEKTKHFINVNVSGKYPQDGEKSFGKHFISNSDFKKAKLADNAILQVVILNFKNCPF